jgi:hypothetical protein
MYSTSFSGVGWNSNEPQSWRLTHDVSVWDCLICLTASDNSSSSVMTQVVSCRPLAVKDRFQSQGSSMWDLWWVKWHWNRFFSTHFGLLCQDHSTTVPHVCFIHQSPRLHGSVVTLKQKKENSLLAS